MASVWHPCRYIDSNLEHDGSWIDGRWYEWEDIHGNREIARMKLDAIDHVTTGHRDWGHDSCDSIEHYDICPRCINKFVADYLGNENASLSAYIEIETEHVCYDEVMYV